MTHVSRFHLRKGGLNVEALGPSVGERRCLDGSLQQIRITDEDARVDRPGYRRVDQGAVEQPGRHHWHDNLPEPGALGLVDRDRPAAG